MSRSSHRKKRLENISVEVSLTPLIDTALTLLIIFMVTTPMLHNAIRIDLPRGNAQENDNQLQELVVTIDKESNIFFNDRPISLDTLGAVIKDKLAQSTGNNKRVWIKVDKSNTVDIFVGAFDCIKSIEGIQDVMVLTQKAT